MNQLLGRFARWGTAALLLIGAGCAQRGPYSNIPAPAAEIPKPPPPTTNIAVDASLRQTAQRELLGAFRSADPVIRIRAVEGARIALGSAARDAILAAMDDKQPAVRFEAAVAAGEMRLTQAKEVLYRLINDPVVDVQVGAIYGLHRIGVEKYTQRLVSRELLHNTDPIVRWKACHVLGRLELPSAIPWLRPMLRDANPSVSLKAAEALWRMRDAEALQVLVAQAQSIQPAQQVAAILALSAPKEAKVREQLRTHLHSRQAEVRLAATWAIGNLGFDDGYTLAIQSAQSAQPRERYFAALALGAIGRLDSQPALAGLVKDTDADVRVAAATAVLQLH